MSIYKGKTLLITGGTGSFGNAVLGRFLDSDIEEIRIFSRDEKKQDDMRKRYANEKLRFHIGDVRDTESVRKAMQGVDCVYHAAALKQVPSCEFFPMEAVKTNIIGTDNVLTAGMESGVKRIICLSTDKAAYPISAMGISKAMMEKVVVSSAYAAQKRGTVIASIRCGNVMCSRGSVIPLFIEQIKNGRPLTVTNPQMTRYMMSLDEAVDLLLFAFEYAEAGDLFVQKSPAATIGDLAQAIIELFDSKTGIRTIGTRRGEKVYETLLTAEERIRAADRGNYFCVPMDKRGLNYGMYFESGTLQPGDIEPYTSHNTTILSVEQIKKKLLDIQYVRDEYRAWTGR